jgi:formylglycine-generating enzyme
MRLQGPRARVLRRLAWVSALAGLACDVHPPPREQPIFLQPVPPPTGTGVLECSFDPVSRPGERPHSGYELCFTPTTPSEHSASEPSPTEIDAHARESDTALDGDASDAEATAHSDAGNAEEVAPCPEEMALAEGEYCPDVRHKCLRYLDEPAPGQLAHRCAEFDRNPACVAPRQHRRFCIDRDEYTPEGSKLPLVQQSWTGAQEICTSLGKRLCFGSEWEFACEGDSLLPYPYGFVRDAKRCNHDRENLSSRGKLRDLRVSSQELPECTSPFGVRNLVGNVDEWVVRDGFVRPWRSGLRGGWWLAGRNNCRASTTGHDEYYFGGQTGFRCCKNAL